LSELGVQQCDEASKLAGQLVNLKTIFVSPLRRALQTAYLLFKEHPNFLSLRFVVHPLLRENMHTVCDIPERFDIVKAEY
jgi:broad specificity phosphatase PhoE